MEPDGGGLGIKLTSLMSRFKRKGIVDGLFQIGVLLILAGAVLLYLAGDKWHVIIPSYVIIASGISFCIFGMIKYHKAFESNPDLLLNEDTQMQAKVAKLLTDDISDKHKVEIAGLLTQKATTPKNLGEE